MDFWILPLVFLLLLAGIAFILFDDPAK